MTINDSHIDPQMTFRKLVFLNMQQLTNFPYIEKDFDALTDYQLLCKVAQYLNMVIENSNDQNDSITNLYNAFISLQDYVNTNFDDLETAFNNLQTFVNNYFDNLDVQEEINNKLDQMLEGGVLEQIIEQFLQSTALWCFDTVADMKLATNLINGSFARTLGYYSINDGGGATYKITNSASLTNFQETLNSGLYAELIVTNNMNILQLGAYGDGIHDDTNFINDAINYCIENKLTLILKGLFNITNTIAIPDSFVLDGNNSKFIYTGNDYLENFIKLENEKNNIVIKNLIIDGNSKVKVGIRTDYNEHVSIENCSIQNLSDETYGGFGVLIWHCDDITIRDSYFNNIISKDNGVAAGDGIAIEFANDCTVDNNTISNCGRHNISVYGLGHGGFNSQYGIRIINNTLKNSYLAGIDSEAGENIIIDGNTFINNGGVLSNNLASSICVKGDGTYLSNKIIITNNNIKTGANTTHALHIDNTCNDIIINSNIIDSTTDVFNMFAGSGAIKVIISNNYIKNGTNVFKHYHSTYQSYVIVNNIIESCTNLIQGSTIGCKVEGNLCLSCTNVFFGAMKFQESTFDNNRVTFSGEFITNYLNYNKTTIRDNSIIYTGETNIPLLTKSGFSSTDKYTIVTGNIITGDITHVIANYEKTTFDDDMNGNTFYQSYYNNNFIIS